MPFVLNMQNEEHYIEMSTRVIDKTTLAELERAAQPLEMDYSECDTAVDKLNATLDRPDEIEARIDELSDLSQLDEIHAEYADMSAWELPPTGRHGFYKDRNPERQRNPHGCTRLELHRHSVARLYFCSVCTCSWTAQYAILQVSKSARYPLGSRV